MPLTREEARRCQVQGALGALAYLACVGAFVALGLLLGAMLSGCGASALERHTIAAGVLHEAAGVAKAIIEADAQRVADAAIAPCAGQDPALCDAALTEAMRPRHRAAAVQRLVAAAVDAYVLAVLAAARSEAPDMSDAVEALGHVLRLYDGLRVMLGEFGVVLPSLGPVVLGLMGGDQ